MYRFPTDEASRATRAHASATGWRGGTKRLLDLTASALGLLVLAPVFVAISVLIRATSRGPVLYRQRRVGLDGRTYEIVKFRTMVDGAEPDGRPIWATNDDPRCTRLGGRLRRFGLDELPQLWNVLRGEMSLVGPRPERPEFAERFTRQWPRYGERTAVRPGITGLAQIAGLRGDTDIGRRLDADLRYLADWSLLGDLSILVKTVPALLFAPKPRASSVEASKACECERG